MKKIIIIVVAALLLISGAVGGTLFFTGAFNEKPDIQEEADWEEESEDDAVDEESDSDGSDPKKKKKRTKKGEPLETFYYHIQPEFVVNFGVKSRPKYLMLEVSVATYDEKVTDVLEKHIPELRNDLLLLYSTKTSEHLATIEGKNALRKETLGIVSKVLKRHSQNDEVEDIFFTRFVMQ